MEQHASEAAFLWTQRARAVDAPHYRLKDLVRLDGRLEAHLDGLRTAGTKGWEKCLGALEAPGPGEVFVAMLIAGERHDGDHITELIKLALEDAAWQRALISALGWLPFARAVPVLEALLEEEHPAVRRLGLAGAAVQRWDAGPFLAPLLTSTDPALRACALETAGLLGRMDVLPEVQRALTDDDEACRFAAAWTLVRLGHRSGPAISLLRGFGDTPGPLARRALAMAMRCMPSGQARDWYSKLRESPEKYHLAAMAAGALGDAACVEDLLNWMALPWVARLAGEAFSFITGVDLPWEDLDGDAPEEEGEAESQEATSDTEGLPWPVAEKVAAWWRQHHGSFQRGTRYLAGRTLSEAGLLEVLRQGTQRQRAAAALEWGLRKPQSPLFEVRAAGHVQTRRLASWTS
nr:TIGR02270 family protein [Myxococcus sp. RHSTA-1-4]